MEAQITTWHYLVAFVLAGMLGAIAHVLRATFNFLPDRLSDSREMDLLVSRDYSWIDYLFETEFNDAGYYELFSARNLKVAIITTELSALFMLLFVPGAASLFAGAVNDSIAWLGQFVAERWSDLRVM